MHEGENRMKSVTLVMSAAAVLLGCTMNGSGPQTAWGKKDVSMLDYRTDAGQCAVLAASSNPQSDASKQAGGISGQNGGVPNVPKASGAADAAKGQQSGNSTSTPAGGDGGMYRDSASPDFVNRAVMQQRNQEMADQRARADALKSCLVNRGYSEFALTPEQRAQLDKLPQGSDARRDYLYKLGTDPEVLTKQAVAKK
jgi:hypothetical protein